MITHPCSCTAWQHADLAHETSDSQSSISNAELTACRVPTIASRESAHGLSVCRQIHDVNVSDYCVSARSFGLSGLLRQELTEVCPGAAKAASPAQFDSLGSVSAVRMAMRYRIMRMRCVLLGCGEHCASTSSLRRRRVAVASATRRLGSAASGAAFGGSARPSGCTTRPGTRGAAGTGSSLEIKCTRSARARPFLVCHVIWSSHVIWMKFMAEAVA